MKTLPRKFWRHLAPSRESLKYVPVNNEVISDPSEVASQYKDFFHSVFLESHCDAQCLENMLVEASQAALISVNHNQVFFLFC